MNQSPRQLRAGVAGSTVGDLAVLNWRLLIHCPRCRETRTMRAHELLRRVGAAARVQVVVDRLKCGRPRCGAEPSKVVAVDPWGCRGVQLRGPGTPY